MCLHSFHPPLDTVGGKAVTQAFGGAAAQCTVSPGGSHSVRLHSTLMTGIAVVCTNKI